MAYGDVLGKKPCGRCDGVLTYKEGKSGSVSGSCNGCGRQTFDRSVKAVTGLRKRLEAKPSDAPAGGGFLDKIF